MQAKPEERLVAIQHTVCFYPLYANDMVKVETTGGSPPQEALAYVV